MKRLFWVTLVVALLLSGLVISGWQNKDGILAKPQSQHDPRAEVHPQAYTKAPGAHVVYDMLFKQVMYFNQQAATEKASGQSVTTFQTMRESFKRYLNLTDAQSLILDNIADDCAREAGLIDQQALEIIRSSWAKYPPGTVFTEENRPKAPKELEELQDKHDEVVLKYRDQLRQQFGDTGFESFESALYRNFGTKITTMPRPPKKIE